MTHILVTLMAGAAVLSAPMASAEPATSGGDPFYCEERGLGPNFYCKPPEPEPEPEAEPEPEPAPPPSPLPVTPPEVAYLEQLQADLKEARIVAVVNPTDENVTRYLGLQKESLEMASAFKDTFRRVGWGSPDLSYTDDYPVDQVGRSAFKSEVARERNRRMAALSDRFGLFYFYSGSCPACHAFGPNLQQFARLHGLDVMAISMDGAPSTYFDNWRVDNGIARRLGLEGTITPAVILFDTQTRDALPVGYGVMSVSEMERRIEALTRDTEFNFMGGQQ